MSAQAPTTVQVLGPGCKRCEALAAVTLQAIGELGLDAHVEKVTDYAQMARMGIMSTPALALEGKVLITGQVPDVHRVKALLSEGA